MAANFKPCSVPGCNGNAHYTAKGARGWCNSHYTRLRRRGDPLAGGRPRPPKGTAHKWLSDHSEHQGDDCLIWPFARNPNGYGVVKLGSKQIGAHHAMCRLKHGEPPSSRHEAAHSCGKGHLGCVNPMHLSWKTRSENHADKLLHGTHNRGEQHSMSKLSEQDIHAIRALDGHKSHREIAAIFGVTRWAVTLVLNRRNWGWLD